jgi:hypothetical protein
VIQVHQVVAFQIRFSRDVSPPPAGDISQNTIAPVRVPGNTYGVGGVALAAAAYDPAHRTVTLTPASPAPVGQYSLTTKQAVFDPATAAQDPGSFYTMSIPTPVIHRIGSAQVAAGAAAVTAKTLGQAAPGLFTTPLLSLLFP